MKRSLSVAAAAIPVVTVGLIGGVSAPAQAEPTQISCTHPWSDKDTDSGTTKSNNAVLRTGPDNSCNVVVRVPGGVSLDFDCYTINDAGKKFTHVQFDDAHKQGWISHVYLDTVSNERC